MSWTPPRLAQRAGARSSNTARPRSHRSSGAVKAMVGQGPPDVPNVSGVRPRRATPRTLNLVGAYRSRASAGEPAAGIKPMLSQGPSYASQLLKRPQGWCARATVYMKPNVASAARYQTQRCAVLRARLSAITPSAM